MDRTRCGVKKPFAILSESSIIDCSESWFRKGTGSSILEGRQASSLMKPLSEEIPEHEPDQDDRPDNDRDLGGIHQPTSIRGARKPFNRRLLLSTDTLDNDIAALAMTGERSQPVIGYNAPAASGIPITL